MTKKKKKKEISHMRYVKLKQNINQATKDEDLQFHSHQM